MNELIQKELRNNVGKKVQIFLKNNFRYKGIVLAVDETSVKLKDFIIGSIILSLDSICWVKGSGNNERKK